MRQASEFIAPSKSAYSTEEGTPVPSGAVTDVTPSRSRTVLSYWVFRMRRNWVVAGIPGEQVMVGLTVPPSELESPPPEPVLLELPPLPGFVLPPLPEPTLLPVPVLELPPVPVSLAPMTPVQLAAPTSRNPAIPVRMECLICVLPFCRQHSETVERSAQSGPHRWRGTT